MPAFESAETLPAAAASVLEQDYGNFVLAISVYPDDSETIAAAEALDDSRVVIVRRSGKGIANGRNSAIRAVDADLYMFLDSDDAYQAGVISAYVADHRKHPAPALRYGDWTAVSPLDGSRTERVVYAPRRAPYIQLLLDNYIATPTVMIDRAVVDEIGVFDERYHHAEDWHLWLRIARRYPLRHVPVNACFYTRSKISRVFPRSFWQTEPKIIEEQSASAGWRLLARVIQHGRYGAYWVGTLRQRTRRDLLDVRPLDLLFLPFFIAVRAWRSHALSL